MIFIDFYERKITIKPGDDMQHKSTLKVLQGILNEVEGLAGMYRSDPKVSKALYQVYQSIANAGSAVISKMTIDEAIEAEARRKEKEERER